MTVVIPRAVGFCANYSDVGDWAFDYALTLARRTDVPLKVFHFLEDPYNPDDNAAAALTVSEREELAIDQERELRLYYDERAGDYLNVGFRLCEDPAWTELHRCLVIREFQVLVLGYLTPTAEFAGRPIEEFADACACPVVLVGPEQRGELRLNAPAALIADKLTLAGDRWTLIAGAPTV